MVLGSRRHQAAPTRPLSPRAALIVALVLVAIGLAASPVRIYHAVMAVLVLAYEYLFRRTKWAASAMGVLRGLNLGAPAVLGLAPGRLLPPPTVLYAAAAFAIYIAAVHGLRRLRARKIDQRAVNRLLLVALATPVVGLVLMVEPWPAVGIAFFVGLVWRAHHRHEEWGQEEVTAASTSLLVGAIGFAALFCLAANRPWDALVVGCLMVVAPLLGLGHGVKLMDRPGSPATPRPSAPPPPPAAVPDPPPPAPEPEPRGPAATTQVAAAPKATKKKKEKKKEKEKDKKPPARKPAARKRPAKPLIPRSAVVYLRLLRVGTLFSPAADVVAGHCLGNVPWSGDLWRVLAASVCLYGAGMVLNDHADREEDAKTRPERPLPQGQIEPDTVLGFGLLLMLVSLLITPIPIYHGVMAVLVLAYDYWLKSITWLGALAMGLLRALNLASGAVLGMAAGSVIPPEAVLYAAAAYAVYIVAVTLLGLLEDDTSNQRAIRGLLCVPPLVAFLVLLAMPHPWPAVGIVFVLVVLLLARHHHREWGREHVRAAMTWLLLGTMAYTSLLCLASGHAFEALVVAAMVVPARLLAVMISLT